MEGHKHRYIPGDHWMVCDQCGFDYRRSEMKKRWDGCWVCKNDWEPKHPQLSVRANRDQIRVPISRPAAQVWGDNLTTGSFEIGVENPDDAVVSDETTYYTLTWSGILAASTNHFFMLEVTGCTVGYVSVTTPTLPDHMRISNNGSVSASVTQGAAAGDVVVYVSADFNGSVDLTVKKNLT